MALSFSRLTAADAPLPRVPPADLSKLSPADFADEELDLPFYLAHFHAVANGIEENGPDRGALKLPVWRSAGVQGTHNARLMENILALAYFYCLDRPWNPYRGHPAVRARMEAALDFWIRAQSPDGRFAEYGPQDWNLAATAFATKFFGETLILLHRGPPIDPSVHVRATAAVRKAIEATLTMTEMYTHGRSLTNQYGNVWGGGLAYFSLHPDPALQALWEKRFHQSAADFQSPAGYYYERDGSDFGYTTTTHDHNSRQAWEWLRGTKLGDEMVAKEARWFEWLAANAVPEPDGGGFILNRAIETRKMLPAFDHYDTPLGEFIPLIRALAESREERVARWRRERDRLSAIWPTMPPLAVGEREAYYPYAFLHRRLNEWRPSTAERDAARALLPALQAATANRQFADSRKAVATTFARRPGYYASFNSGQKLTVQQRYGLGLLWTPQLGAVLQSQTNSDVAAWGTQAAGAKSVYENASMAADFSVEGQKLPKPVPGVHNLPSGELVFRYPLAQRGTKAVTFAAGRVSVAVTHAGEFTEVLPLLVPSDGRIELESRRALLKSPRGTFVVNFGAGVDATLRDIPGAILRKRVVSLLLRATDTLTYDLATETK